MPGPGFRSVTPGCAWWPCSQRYGNEGLPDKRENLFMDMVAVLSAVPVGTALVNRDLGLSTEERRVERCTSMGLHEVAQENMEEKGPVTENGGRTLLDDKGEMDNSYRRGVEKSERRPPLR